MKRAAALLGLTLLAFGRLWAQVAAAPAGSDQTVGTLLASDASVHGSVVLAGGGTNLESGTAVDTASSAATIALKRGGALRVCPSSSVTLTQTQSGDPSGGLMISVGGGSIEAAYGVRTNADAIVTPDFRIVLAGPADFHFALGANSHGDTCVRPLTGNSGAILVNELMGAGSYQVKPAESVVFRGGKVSGAAPAIEDCGCPESRPENQVAAEPKPATPSTTPTATPALPLAAAAPASEKAPVPPPAPGQVQVQVDAPFVFSAVSPEPPLAQVATLKFEQIPVLPLPTVEPPPAAPVSAPVATKPAKKGFFGHIGSFFSSFFHHKSSSPHAS